MTSKTSNIQNVIASSNSVDTPMLTLKKPVEIQYDIDTSNSEHPAVVTPNLSSKRPSLISNETEAETCIICIGEMTIYDHKFPLVCPSECGFNMCGKCIQRSFRGKKGLCPQCRGDLASSHETVLTLRHCAADSDELGEITDEELSSGELQRKYKAIATMQANIAKKEDFKQVEDERVETNKIDKTLCCGLDDGMTEEEILFVTQWMTSGCTDKLSHAAVMLQSILEMSKNGMIPSVKHSISSNNPRQVRPSEHCQKTVPSRQKNGESRVIRTQYSSRSTRDAKATREMLKNRIEQQIEVEKVAEWKRLHPLPTRMPCSYKFVVDFDVNTPRGCMLMFVDDETLLENKDMRDDESLTTRVKDAYSRLTVDRKGNVLSRPMVDDRGLERILVAREKQNFLNPTNTLKSIMPWRRVVLSMVKGSLSRLGLRVGDVITHVNGDFFSGNAESLKFYLSEIWQRDDDHDKTIQIVVNAEIGVAEALHLRSLY